MLFLKTLVTKGLEKSELCLKILANIYIYILDQDRWRSQSGNARMSVRMSAGSPEL